MKRPSQPPHGAWLGYSTPSSHPPNPKPSAIEASIWHEAEQATGEIIQRIRPTVVSETRKMVIMEYVQNLIRGAIGIETLPFGSFPLKTYLPDGDIDLTVICSPNTKDSIISNVHAILEKEELNADSEFVMKDVQHINAEIQIIKCLAQNVMVDIFFNQIGGLCSLCFLEVIDRRIGKDHLFKRSIMLVKAWCYYEGRILGSHRSLISTYSIAILVLYIFNFFHSSLDGPLTVLYRFLDYYSKFDWVRYCITLRGPVSISYLPELLDLSGDYEWQLNNLNYAVYCHELTSNPHFIPMGHAISYSDFIRGQNAWTYASGYKIDGARKSRGTGVFFPNVNYDAFEWWHSPSREKNLAFEIVYPTARDKFQADKSQVTNLAEKEYHEPIVFGGDGFVKLPTQSDAPKSSSQHAS